VTEWILPLQTQAEGANAWVTKEQVMVLFSIIPEILELHKEMVKMIRERAQEWSPNQKIADIFIENSRCLKMYTEYVNNYDRAIIVLSKIQENKNCVKFLKTCQEREPCKGQSIMGFLILPIQRLPRYRLLLEDLLKSSIDGYHKDYEALAAAVSRVCHVADYINSEKRKSDALHKLLDLQMIFKDKNNEVIHDIVSETRMLILEKIMFYKNGKKGQKRYIYLFNDSLIITKDKSMSKNGKQIVINFAMDMKTVNLEDAGETDLTITIQNFKEIKAKFANATDKQKFF